MTPSAVRVWQSVAAETGLKARLYDKRSASYTGSVKNPWRKLGRAFVIWTMSAGAVVCAQSTTAQGAKPGEGQPQSEKQVTKEEKLPFQIELLETRVRFEANGDSRKEVHTVVKINDAGGARQFAVLGFDYNRAFQSVEIPLVMMSADEGGDIEVPDFRGKTMREVTEACMRLGLNPVLVGSSLATQQTPATGSKVRRGAKVTVQFGMLPLHPGKAH